MVEKYIDPFIQKLKEDRFSIDVIEEAKFFAYRMRTLGVPELFPLGANDLREEREIWTPLIDVLLSAIVEGGREILIPELAREINQRVGQYLPDDVQTRELLIPNAKIERTVERLDTDVHAVYNKALMAFIRARYLTIGSMRDTSADVMRRSRNVSDNGINFFKTAFARAQEPR